MCKTCISSVKIHFNRTSFERAVLVASPPTNFIQNVVNYVWIIEWSYSDITEFLQLKVQSHSRNLRSSRDKLLFQIPHGKTKVTLGDRAFVITAPK